MKNELLILTLLAFICIITCDTDRDSIGQEENPDNENSNDNLNFDDINSTSTNSEEQINSYKNSFNNAENLSKEEWKKSFYLYLTEGQGLDSLKLDRYHRIVDIMAEKLPDVIPKEQAAKYMDDTEFTRIYYLTFNVQAVKVNDSVNEKEEL